MWVNTACRCAAEDQDDDGRGERGERGGGGGGIQLEASIILHFMPLNSECRMVKTTREILKLIILYSLPLFVLFSSRGLWNVRCPPPVIYGRPITAEEKIDSFTARLYD